MSPSILAFSTTWPDKGTCLVSLFDRKLQVLKNSQKIDHFWHFLLTFLVLSFWQFYKFLDHCGGDYKLPSISVQKCKNIEHIM